MRQGRERAAVTLLRSTGTFPERGNRCLEVGYGRLGWLAALLGWGLRFDDLYGVELDPGRAEEARDAMPGAHLEVGDATEMDFPDGTFDIVVLSTVFSSILAPGVRKRLAAEVLRVLKPGGAALWYDFRVDNPGNPHVKGVPAAEIRRLFPEMTHRFRSVTLAPPVARAIVPISWVAATVVEVLPFLRTHILGVLTKNPSGKGGPDAR